MIGRNRTPRCRGPVRPSGRVRGGIAGAFAALVVCLGALAGPGLVAAADKPTLKVDPATQSAGPGQEFVVNVLQSATVPTTGAQVNVTFDPKLLQIKDFELGPAYTGASAIFAFGNADLGTNGNKDLTQTRANKFGTLENVAGFLLPGSGVVPPGDNVFLKITFVAQSGEGGDVTIGLGRGSMIGETGESLAPLLENGAVTVGSGGAPAPSGSAGEPSPSPSAAPSEAPAALANPKTPVKVFIAPTSIELKAGLPARIFLVANADGNISSITADLTFDKNKLEITGIEAGSAWTGATVIAVATGSTPGLAGAIGEANSTGILQQAGAFFPPGTPELPDGEAVFVSVLVKGKVDGTSTLSVGNATALGVEGETIPVEIAEGSFTKPPEKGLELDPTLVIPLVALALVLLGGTLLIRTGRIPVRIRRRAPFYLSLVLGLIPVALFLGVVATVVVNAAPIVAPGIPAILTPQDQTRLGTVDFGLVTLLPALWGSVLVTLVALAIALPISMALAIVAVDFWMGPITRLVRPLVGVLAGVPPIVYAVSVPFFITALMIPKFAANATFTDFDPATVGADPATWPPADVPYSAGGFPWNPIGENSVLLGGVLIALFLIPFVTPLFVDALRDVPRAAREASLALGANRTYTFRRVVLPRALPAIIGASMLAILKALGDTIIVLFAVGFAADSLPRPLFDVLERTTTLAARGANLIGSFETLSASCKPYECALGYSSALLLLVAAGVVVVIVSYLQGRGRRRVAT